MSVITLVPHLQIPPDYLNKLLDSFIGREGTDYGEIELSLEEKRDNLKELLVKQEVFIAFDGESESFNLLPRSEVIKLKLELPH
jgi:uncharacterized protein